MAKPKDDDLLQEIRENFDYDYNNWDETRKAGSADMRVVAGDPWDPADRTARETAGRPVLSLDELGQYFNQLINEARINPRAAKFDPVGDGANDETARFYADKWREIEYRSRAQIVYTTALQNAIHRSYGWARVKTEYLPGSLNQEIVLEEFVNPDMVVPDTDAKRPTFSDMRHCFVVEDWKIRDFKRRFPKAKTTDFSRFESIYPRWVKGEKIQVAEYWRMEPGTRKILAVRYDTGEEWQGPEEEFTLPDGATTFELLKTREESQPKVMKYLTNGVEILERTEWAGHTIPIRACTGLIIYVDEGSGTKRKILSMTRLARDPYMLYCYYRTTQAELVGMTPRTPFVGYKGQFRGVEDVWQTASHTPVAYLEANPTTEETGTQVLPLPQRQPYDPPIERLEVGAEGARRAIQAAMGGAPLPTSAQRRNEKSGVALKQIENVQSKGNFHFIDHYEEFIQSLAEIGEDLMDKVIDTARDVSVIDQVGKAYVQRVNDPRDEQSVPTKGRHQVTIATGPDFDSEREAASDFADTLAQIPAVFPLIAPLLVKLKNLGPIGDEIAEKLKYLQPPEMRAMDTEDGEEPDPQELQAQLMQAMRQLEQAKQAIGELSKERDGKLIENRTKYDIAMKQIDAELKKAQMEVEKAIEVARINASARLLDTTEKVSADALENQRDRQQEAVLTIAKMSHDDTVRHEQSETEALTAAREARQERME